MALTVFGYTLRFAPWAIFFSKGHVNGGFRLCRSWNGRWKRRWVQLPLFGIKRKGRIIETQIDRNTTRIRHQTWVTAWMPYFLYMRGSNDLDQIIYTTQPEDAEYVLEYKGK